jgi:hypothetical protein
MPEARSRFQSWLAILAGERSHLCNLHEIGRLSGCGRLTLSAKLALWFVTLVITILCHKPPAGCYQVSVSLGECWEPPPPEVIPDITKIFNKILGGAPYTLRIGGAGGGPRPTPISCQTPNTLTHVNAHPRELFEPILWMPPLACRVALGLWGAVAPA